MSALVSFGLLHYQYLLFSAPIVWQRFEIWRIITGCLFAGGFSFNFLMHLYVLYQISTAYESNHYNTCAGGTSADYLWMSFIGMIAICVTDAIYPLGFLADAFLYFVMYVRSRRSPDDIMNMWGFKFKALYMPWVYLAFRMLMGNSIKSALAGAVLGHIFYFLIDVVPISYGYNIIKTPVLFMDITAYLSGRSVPVVNNVGAGGIAPPSRRTGGGMTGYNWGGTGRTLGTN